MSEQVKIYVTKYALSSGIFEVMATVKDGMASFRRDGGALTEYVHGRSFHYTREHAVEEAEEMRIRKLKSLDKQFKKVSTMKFE